MSAVSSSRRLLLAYTLVGAIALEGCGGGEDSSAPVATPGPVPVAAPPSVATVAKVEILEGGALLPGAGRRPASQPESSTLLALRCQCPLHGPVPLHNCYQSTQRASLQHWLATGRHSSPLARKALHHGQ